MSVISAPPTHATPHSRTAPDVASTPAALQFLYLSEPDMIAAGATDMSACIDTMEETLTLLHRGDYRMAGPNGDSHGAMITFPQQPDFPGMPADGPDRRFMAMPAYLGGQFRTTGVKWYGSNIANRERGLPRSILMMTLNDTDTGAPLAFMSANLLSAYRTGAIAGAGARHFAPRHATVVAVLGPGVMARTTLEALMCARPSLRELKVQGRSAQSTAEFVTWVEHKFPQLAVRVVHSIEDLVRDSDIVTFTTSTETGDPSTYPTIRREWVRPGAFFAMPAACQIDDAMLGNDVRKVVDNSGLYEAWAQEVPRPTHASIPIIGCRFTDLIAEGKIHPDAMEDLGAVIAGDSPGRGSEEEIVVLSVGGMPVEDVAWATVLYRRAISAGIGTPLPLWSTPELS